MKAYVVEREAVAHNIAQIRKWAGDAAVWAVLKGNGYGLGAGAMAALCWENGIRRFAVTEPSEARDIRESVGPGAEILMLRATTDLSELQILIDLQVILTLGSREDAQILADLDQPCRVHLKVDTGMGRYGFLTTEGEAVRQALAAAPKVTVAGVYTHFHSAFLEERITRQQFARFSAFCDQLEAEGLSLGERHCCNTSAFLRFKDMHLSGVRVGSGLLGRVAVPNTLGLQPVGWAEASIEELRALPRGHTVGYGAATTLKRDTRCAVVPVGYYHGFTLQRGTDVWRAKDCVRGILHNLKLLLRPKHLTVRVGDSRARTLGHVGMLHTCVDVTDLPCQVGDLVRLEINPLHLKGLPVEYR